MKNTFNEDRSFEKPIDAISVWNTFDGTWVNYWQESLIESSYLKRSSFRNTNSRGSEQAYCVGVWRLKK